MPPRPRAKPVGPKDLCIYVVTVNEENGTVKEDVIRLLRKCVMDKIFAESQDHIAICRSNSISNVEFLPVNWNALREVERKFREQFQLSQHADEYSDGLAMLMDISKVLVCQGSEDSYENKKIICFDQTCDYDVKDSKLATKLAKYIKEKDISLSIIVPDDKQETVTYLKDALREDDNDNVNVTTYEKALRQISNTLSKKPIKPMGWTVNMEISPDIQINVSGYLCTRKNKIGEMTKALMKEVPVPSRSNKKDDESPSISVPPSTQAGSNGSANAATAASSVQQETKTVIVELAKNVTEKEISWKEKDGSVVAEQDVGKGYMYGDKVIPFNELEAEGLYESGEKCLKVLVFCPTSTVNEMLQQGDGTTLFYPKKGDTLSMLKFNALLKALVHHGCVAIVKKVYRKGTALKIGVLYPDEQRQCLVYSDLAFADDVSIPHFATLVGETSSEDDGVTVKDQLIDDLIKDMSIDEFSPEDGPVDPAVTLLRENIASKILSAGGKEEKPTINKLQDGIEVFFSEAILQNKIVEGLNQAFPLKVNKEESDRPAGANIFRKRHREDEIENNGEMEKKPKKEATDSDHIEKESGLGTLEEKPVDYDELLDEL